MKRNPFLRAIFEVFNKLTNEEIDKISKEGLFHSFSEPPIYHYKVDYGLSEKEKHAIEKEFKETESRRIKCEKHR